MALSESAVSELLDAFRGGNGVDLIRDAVTMVLQELIKVEATEHIGAGRYERTGAADHGPQWFPGSPVDHAGGRCRAAHPEAPQRLPHPVDPRTPAGASSRPSTPW
jgi:hypothetical protein